MLAKFGIDKTSVKDIMVIFFSRMDSMCSANAQRKSSIDRVIVASPVIGGLLGSCAGGRFG